MGISREYCYLGFVTLGTVHPVCMQEDPWSPFQPYDFSARWVQVLCNYFPPVNHFTHWWKVGTVEMKPSCAKQQLRTSSEEQSIHLKHQGKFNPSQWIYPSWHRAETLGWIGCVPDRWQLSILWYFSQSRRTVPGSGCWHGGDLGFIPHFILWEFEQVTLVALTWSTCNVHQW